MLILFHLAAISVTLLLVLYCDEEAVRYLFGMKNVLSARKIHMLHVGVAVGFAFVICTGGLLYSRSPERYLADTSFLVKMCAVLALIVNSYFIERFSQVAAEAPFITLSSTTKRAFLTSGAVSAGSWLLALACGFLL